MPNSAEYTITQPSTQLAKFVAKSRTCAISGHSFAIGPQP